jgi:hypothetical protein
MAMMVLILYAGTVQADGWSPLYVASDNCRVEVVRALIKAGADVGQATVSWGAAWWGCGLGAVRCVVYGVLCDACGLVGVVRWWYGLVWWRAGALAVSVLIVYVGTVQTDGWTPLLIASGKGHVEVVRALLEAGADVGQAMVSRACSVGGDFCELSALHSTLSYPWQCFSSPFLIYR